MPEITGEATIDFEAYCAKCGAGICSNVTTGKTFNRQHPFIEIEPCEECLKKAHDEGYEEGCEETKERLLECPT